MKKMITFSFILFGILGYSQDEIPVLKYTEDVTMYNTSESFANNVFVTAGYSYLNFLNKRFNENIIKEKLKRDFSFFLGFDFSTKYYKFGVFYSNNKFKVLDSYQYTIAKDSEEENLQIGVSNFEGKIDLMLLPQVKFMSLFVGGGYRYCMIDSNNEEKAKKNFGQPIWEAGIDIFITSKFKIFGSYVQSFDNKSVNAINRVDIGIGYSLKGY